MHKGRFQRPQRSVSWCQHLLRRSFWHPRCNGRLSLFLIKTRLQSYSPFLPVGTQHKYRNALDGCKQVYNSEGVKGLYRGITASMVRTGAGSSVQLPTYFFAKRRLIRHAGMEEGLPLHLLSSAASGFVVCCVMHPPVRPSHSDSYFSS